MEKSERGAVFTGALSSLLLLPSEKAQRGEQGWSEVESRNGEAEEEATAEKKLSKDQEASKSRSRSMIKESLSGG